MLKVYQDNDSIPAFGLSREVESVLHINICLTLASEWMKKCNEHPLCGQQPLDATVPTRVIDVGLEDDSDTVYLKENIFSSPYMSLSHCWGKDQIITTTTKTLQDRKSGIKLCELSKTFRDAVQITRGLGIQYLWIDSLCILQDDRVDWEIESAKMASVYMNSHLNLAATHSSNGKGGCLSERWSLDGLSQTELNIGNEIVIEPTADEEGHYKIYVRNILHVAHDQFTRTKDYAHTVENVSPLLKRGWVFQERLLSTRTLHFHAEELIWECSTGISCECSRLTDFQRGDPDGTIEERNADQLKSMYSSINSTNVGVSQVLDTWLELVTEYCTLKLTNQSDRLPALSGLASRVMKGSSSKYLAGIWWQDLPRALCWQKHFEYQNKYPSLRAGQDIAPSWSWASVWDHSDDVSGITYNLVTSMLGFLRDPRCRIQDFKCKRNATNPLGNSPNLWLKIQAPLIQGTFIMTELATDSGSVDWAQQQNLTQYLPKTRIWNNIEFNGKQLAFSGDCFDTKGKLTEISHGDTVYCLLLGHMKSSEKDFMDQYPLQTDNRGSHDSSARSAAGYGAYALVLVKADEESTYKRVGLSVEKGGSDWWDSADIVDVTLV